MKIDRTTFAPTCIVWRSAWSERKAAATVAFCVSDVAGVVGRLELHPQPGMTAVLMPMELADNLPAKQAAKIATMLVQQAVHEAKEQRIATLSVLPFVELSGAFAAALSEAGFDNTGWLQKWQRVLTLSQEPGPLARAGGSNVKEQSATHMAIAGASQPPPIFVRPNVRIARHICNGERLDPLSFDPLPQEQSNGDETPSYVTRSDLHQFLELVLANANDFEGVQASNPKDLLQTWELIDSNVQLVVAVDDGKLSGIVVVNSQQAIDVPPGNNIVIEYLGVHPEKRRQGLGALLISSVLENIPQAGVCSVYVSAKNEPAIAFYLSNGFNCIDQSSFWTLNCCR